MLESRRRLLGLTCVANYWYDLNEGKQISIRTLNMAFIIS